jgi:hypothetical protein
MPKQAIEEFRELYRRRYGIELTDAEAEAIGLRPENFAIWYIYPRARMGGRRVDVSGSARAGHGTGIGAGPQTG